MNAVNAPKIIKVVNLKRFMPHTLEAAPKFKMTRYSPVSNSQLSYKDGSADNSCNGSAQHVLKSQLIQSSTEETKDIQKCPETNENITLSSRSKIKFRNCSHSPDELSTLHEHTDDTLVKVGDKFDNRDAFKQYLNDNAKRWHYYYVCRNSKKKIIEYNCICMAYNIKEREVVIRRQKKRTTACPCKIRLTIDQATHKVVVYYVCNHHDHPTTANAFYHYPHAKYLPQHVKEEFLDLTYLGLEVELIQKYIHSIVGLTIKKKDIWSYAYRFKRKIFKRSMSEERRKDVKDLMTKIRQTYGESLDTVTIERPIPIANEEVTKFRRSRMKNDNTLIASLTDDLSMNSEDSLLKALENSPLENTQVIVQYINEDGILCDENGVLITNSSSIIQFINDYADVTPDEYLETDISIDGHEYTIQEESLFEWDIGEKGASGLESESTVDGEEMNKADEPAHSKCLEQNETGITCEKRLSPTPATAAVYAEINNFRKYYYVDHQYTTHGEQNREPSVVPKKTDRGALDSTIDPTREEYVKAPDFVSNPTSLRHCSGHDNLTLLTDPDAILPGAKFLSHAAFLAFINQRARRWYFYYSLVESGRAPENYVYKCVYGKTRVSRNAYRAKGLRKRNKLTTQCPCQIRLRRLEPDPAYLTVLYSCNHHDHALDAGQFTAQPHSRRLPDHIKEEVKDLISLRVSLDIIRKHVAAETGVRVYGKYFHNVRASMRARGERRQHTERRRAELAGKVRELEARYGNAAKENPQNIFSHNQAKKQVLSALQVRSVQTEDRSTQAGLDETGIQTQEYCELSDKDDFAEEVCILQTDTLPVEDTARQSRLETRLQKLSHKEILMKVRQLQDSVRCDGLRSDVQWRS